MEYYRIPTHTNAWHRFRTTGITEEDAVKYSCPSVYEGGIGASEMGTILGQNKWRPSVMEYFHYKTGTETPKKELNRSMLMGVIHEPIIKDMWMFYDGTEDGWIHNYMKWFEGSDKSQSSVRKARKVNAYIVNEKYPYLFVSLDYHSEKNTYGISDGVIHPNGFPIEIKSINSLYAKTWEGGVPDYHITQVNQQMIVVDAKYCELAILVDGREFKCMPFERNDYMCEQIVNTGEVFWGRVMKARSLLKTYNECIELGELEKAEQVKSYIYSLEPEPDESEGTSEYLRERYKQEIQSTQGSNEQYLLGKEYNFVNELINSLTEKKTGLQNKFLYELDYKGAEQMDFGELGKISFKENKNGLRSLRVGIKEKPTKEQINKQIIKIDFKY